MYNSALHSKSHLIKAMLGYSEKLFPGIDLSPKELLVLNYHSTQKKFISNFESQLDYFRDNFNIISPEQLNDYYFNPDWKSDRCSLLFTFDDGLKNNLYALELLDKFNIKSFLFIVPGFIETDFKAQKKFYINNIRPSINDNIDFLQEDFSALSLDDLRSIVQAKHQVGCHTYTHTLTAADTNSENSLKEIMDSKTFIENKLNTNVKAFCSINDTLKSVGKCEKDLIAKNYTFHFTTLPGSNYLNKDPLFIKRRNVEAFWMKGAVYFAIGNRDLKRWKNKIRFYEDL